VEPRTIAGRYALFGEIASGGMATVYYGRLLGAGGFARTVAVKQLHAQLARNPEFVAMLLDEARLAARIRHPNVVPTLDVVATASELFLVLEYVHGESFARLHRATREAGAKIDPRIARAVLIGALHGLHAAHEALSEDGAPLGLVHRDVSPQNILVGVDGAARILDFGVAKADGRLQATRQGQLKGKLAYMAPEQLGAGTIDRRTDVYAAGVVLWEALAGRRLFRAESEAATVHQVMANAIPPPSEHTPGLDPELDGIVLRATAKDPDERFPTARDMAVALEHVDVPGAFAPASEVSAWCELRGGDALLRRADQIREVEAAMSARSSEEAREAVHAVGSSRPPAPAPAEGDAPASPPSVGRAGAPSLAPGAAPPPAPRPLLSPTASPVAVAALVVMALGVVALVIQRSVPPEPAVAAASDAPSAVALTAPAGPGEASVAPGGACPAGMARVAGGRLAAAAGAPRAPIDVRAFCIDITEVTTSAYKRCVDEGACRRAPHTNAGRGISEREAASVDPLCNGRAPEERGAHPINCVPWAMADAFCAARKARLPSEAEWELAAGGAEGAPFPWGDAKPSAKLLNACGAECTAWAAKAKIPMRAAYDGADGWANTAPIGSFPGDRTSAGVSDLAGNVREWMADRFGASVADGAADPPGAAPGGARVVRGGAWSTGDPAAASRAHRDAVPEGERRFDIGFRCALSL